MNRKILSFRKHYSTDASELQRLRDENFTLKGKVYIWSVATFIGLASNLWMLQELSKIEKKAASILDELRGK